MKAIVLIVVVIITVMTNCQNAQKERNKVTNAYDVTFTPEAKQLFVYNTMLHADLKKTHSDESQRLPIPATYVID